MLVYTLFPLFLFIFAIVDFTGASVPFVQTRLGGVVGTYKESFGGRKFEAYEGIPFALPPVQYRRFQAPERVQKWVGNLTATKAASPCIQYGRDYTKNNIIGIEDCLYLNIYVPASSNRYNKTLPVLFSIYGGAFQYGSPVTSKFLMDRDVILASTSYRVGLLGFLSTEDEVVPGNNGLKDQSLALRFIAENIRDFGGDPERITLIGYSAGGASVHYHYLSPMSKGLFRNGISFSGTTFGPSKLTENSREKALKLAAVLGCPTESIERMVECLRHKPAHAITEATKHFVPWLYNPFTPFGPVIERGGDKSFIDRSPIEIISNGDAADVPWFTSVVSEEGLYACAVIVNNEAYLKDLNDNWEKIAPHLLDFNYTIPLDQHAEVSRKIRNYYFGTKPIDRSTTKELISMLSDRLYVVSAEKAARAQAEANKSPVLFWYYSYRALTSASDRLTKSKKNYGVSHSDDILMIVDNDVIYPPATTRDREMQLKLIDLVVSVAEKGYPNLGLDFEWKKVDPNKKAFDYLHIAGPDTIRMESQTDLGQKNFWSTIDFDENKL